MKKKIRVGIIFGGKSTEHEVSIQSAQSIYSALDKKKYNIFLIGIDKQGRWHMQNEEKLLDTKSNFLVAANKTKNPLHLSPGKDIWFSDESKDTHLDVIFPVLHGTNGEDGSVQGMLKVLNIPCVGSGVLGSAIGISKDITKKLLTGAGIPVADFLVFKESEREKIKFSEIKNRLGLPFFVKPANLGSSVGVSKVKNKRELADAIKQVFMYDTKILFEEYIKGREIECAVLGSDVPTASVPGEVIPVGHEFYTYESKYMDEKGYKLVIPANLPKRIAKKIQQQAISVFKTLECSGMARVDFFVTSNHQIIVNEINTIPGFTKISMYPKLWEASGVSYPDLINRLIELAIERYNSENKIYSKLK